MQCKDNVVSSLLLNEIIHVHYRAGSIMQCEDNIVLSLLNEIIHLLTTGQAPMCIVKIIFAYQSAHNVPTRGLGCFHP